MTKELEKFVHQNYPEKADRIIRYALSEKKLVNACIMPRKNEVFTRYPKWPDYYGSNYGRCVSVKGDKVTLLQQPSGGNGYIIYTMTKPSVKRYKRVVREGQTFTISANRLVGELFLPDFWPELAFNEKQCHHMDHIRTANIWKNLLLLPATLHFWINRVDTVWFSPGNGKPFKKMHPYAIMRKTGLTLEQIILCLRDAKPDVVTYQDDVKINVYMIDGHMIGYTMCPNYDSEDED